MPKKIKTPLRYPGGKTKAIDIITPFIKNYDKIVSLSTGGDTMKLFISNSQIKIESDLIKGWIINSGIYPGFKDVVWNGNSLYIESSSGTVEYVANRMDIIDMVPELSQVSLSKVRQKL